MSNEVWVFAEHQEDKLRKVTLEVLAKGRELAERLGVGLAALLLGAEDDGLAEEVAWFADTVHQWSDSAVAIYNCDIYLQVLTEFVRAEAPQIIIGGATCQTRDFFPRVAASLGAGIGMDCVDMWINDDGHLVTTRPFFGGKVLGDVVARDERPQIALVRPNTFPVPEARDGKQGRIVTHEVQIDSDQVGLETLEVIRTAKAGVDLTEADVIVTGGRGLQKADNFAILEELAGLLDGTVGASRAVVDSGWRPHTDQVGKSGKTVAPNLYIAVGLSGAIHHVMGMDTSKIVVAINKDPRAPIFEHADFGIVGDLFEIIPRLTEELRRSKGME
jgi:electron transfer flavoprotein alpha subunit